MHQVPKACARSPFGAGLGGLHVRARALQVSEQDGDGCFKTWSLFLIEQLGSWTLILVEQLESW